MSEAKKIKSPTLKPPRMVKITVGDKSFETFIAGHEIDQGPLGRYDVKLTLMAKDDEELLVMQEVLRYAVWPEVIGENTDDH